jgi:hypothetical protein
MSIRRVHLGFILTLLVGCNGDSTPPAPPQPIGEGIWAVAAPMTAARDPFTVTPLPDGSVLAAGGSGAGGAVLPWAEVFRSIPGIWIPTGSLNQARSHHTATLLPNGKVLITGGTGSSGPLDSAEIYDPATGAWTLTGAMSAARTGHTATLLPSGKVLVAGGSEGPLTLDSAELYDPVLGVWAPTGSMSSGRTNHTATGLPNGTVLVAGGVRAGAFQPLASVEVYDPVTGLWTATGDLTAPRQQHSATLLPNGSVLVAGGLGGPSGTLGSTELYHPASGTWTQAGFLAAPRRSHSATLLANGKALVVGGRNGDTIHASAEMFDPATSQWSSAGALTTARAGHAGTELPNGQYLVAGGLNASGVLASTEVYSPVLPGTAGSWSATGNLLSSRSSATVVMLTWGPHAGAVLAAGGSGADGAPLASAELYTPALGTWSSTGSLNVARTNHAAVLLADASVLVAGGQEADGDPLASAERYQPTTGQWAATGNLSSARTGHTATLLTWGPNAGKVLVAGGSSAGTPLDSVELYDPLTGQWAPTGSLQEKRTGHRAVLVTSGPHAGEILVIGGTGESGQLASAELYDPVTGVWSAAGSLANARRNFTATVLTSGPSAGQVLVAGGTQGVFTLSSAELYDPITGTWSATADLQDGRQLHTSTRLPNGTILVAGGIKGGAFLPLASAEVYDPAAATWTTTGTMATARSDHATVLLPTGLALALGGFGGPVGRLASSELYASAIP